MNLSLDINGDDVLIKLVMTVASFNISQRKVIETTLTKCKVRSIGNLHAPSLLYVMNH